MFRRSVNTLLLWKRNRRDGEPPAGANADWIRGNDLFHLAIQEAAGNDRLRGLLADLHLSFPRDLTWIVLGESSRLLERNVAEHTAILGAIERHDPPEARRLMNVHVRHAGELVVRRLEQRGR